MTKHKARTRTCHPERSKAKSKDPVKLLLDIAGRSVYFARNGKHLIRHSPCLDLDFKVLGVDAAVRGLAPLLHFKIEIVNQTGEKVQSVMLHAQIQIQSPLRAYTTGEKEKLRELFGRPEDWGQTLRNKLLAHANCTVPGFAGRTEAALVVPCTFDLNVAATKYFYALEDGEVPLLFLFSGTVFYSDARRAACKSSRFLGKRKLHGECRLARGAK